MIPIHYFLALLAILASMTGCTQKAPPGSPQLISLNNTGVVDAVSTPTPSQHLNRGNDPTVKPQVKPESNAFTLAAPNASEWNLAFAGDDSKVLYQLLEVPYEKSKKDHGLLLSKIGNQLACSRSKMDHVCAVILNSSNGEIKNSKNKLELVGADTELKELYHSSFFDLDPSPARTGRLLILGDNAKKIYEALSVNAQSLKNNELTNAHDRFGKQGKHVACYQEVFGADQQPSFSCKFFYDYDTGTFDEITGLY